MNRKPLIAVGALLLVGAAAASLLMMLQGERERRDALTAQVAALETGRQSVAQGSLSATQVGAGEQSPPAVAASSSTAAAGSSASAQTPAVPAAQPGGAVRADAASARDAGPARDAAGQAMAAMNDPGTRDAMRGMMRALMQGMYPDIEQEVGLSAEEAEKFLDLLSGQAAALGGDALGMMMGGGPQDPAARQATQLKLLEQQEAQEQELAAMLGSRYPKWQAYQATGAAREQVNQLRAALGAAGVKPLEEAQSQALISALASEQRRAEQEERAWLRSAAAASSPNLMQEQIGRAMEAQNRMTGVVAEHLNTEQLAQYRQMTGQAMEMMRAVMGMMGGQEGAPAPAPSPGAGPR